MATQLSILFGEMVSDNSIQRAVPLPAGVFEMGALTIAGTGPWTATINPGGDRNTFVWREVGSDAQGRGTIKEDAPVNFTVPAASALPRIDLLVGCHQWVDASTLGDCMTNGQPNAFMDASMYPYYLVVEGVPAASPVPPTLAASYSGPNGTGGAPVVLAQVSVPATGGGTPTVSAYIPTDCRWSSIYPYLQEIITARPGPRASRASRGRPARLERPARTEPTEPMEPTEPTGPSPLVQ